MAVTINEMHVEVHDPPKPSAAPAASGGESHKDIDLHQALRMANERRMRLHAD